MKRTARRILVTLTVAVLVLGAVFAAPGSTPGETNAQGRSVPETRPNATSEPAAVPEAQPVRGVAVPAPEDGTGADATSGPIEAAVDPAAFLAQHQDKLPQVKSVDRRNAQAPARTFNEVQATADAEGTVSVTAGLQTRFTPEALLDEPAVAAQRAEIAAARAEVLEALAGVQHRELGSYQSLPYLSLELEPEGVAALEQSGLAATLEPEVEDEPALSSTTPIVQSTDATALGVDGSGFSVAVIDTGVQNNHPFLNGRVVSEACFSVDGDCPNGGTAQIGAGSAAPCTFQNKCDHGTHVAGIAAGRRAAGGTFDGVASGANIVAINASNEGECTDANGEVIKPVTTCPKFSRNDELAALNRVFDIRDQFNVAAVNMSLGGGEFSDSCDSESESIKDAINQLLAAGIPTFVSSGNNGYTDAIGFPACISTAFAVGATDLSDNVLPKSNSDDQVAFLAPGSEMQSSVPGVPGGYGKKEGTSMAAPHVAGAFTALLERWGTGSGSRQLRAGLVMLSMQLGGTPVTDSKNNVTKSRIAMMPSLHGMGFAYLTGYDTETGIADVNRLHTEGGLGVAVESPNVGKGLTVVEPFNVGSKEFVLQYNATSGTSQRYEIGADGKRGALVATHSWSKGWTLIRHLTINGITYRLFYNGTTGAGLLYELTATGGNGTNMGDWGWAKGWTSIEHVTVGSKMFRVFYRATDGKQEIRGVTSTAGNGSHYGTGQVWSAGWTQVQHVAVGTKSFRLFYNATSGKGLVYELTADGTNGALKADKSWTKGFTQVRHVVDRGIAYRFFYQASSGSLGIYRVDPDGTNGAHVHSGVWKVGKEVVIPSFVQG